MEPIIPGETNPDLLICIPPNPRQTSGRAYACTSMHSFPSLSCRPWLDIRGDDNRSTHSPSSSSSEKHLYSFHEEPWVSSPLPLRISPSPVPSFVSTLWASMFTALSLTRFHIFQGQNSLQQHCGTSSTMMLSRRVNTRGRLQRCTRSMVGSSLSILGQTRPHETTIFSSQLGWLRMSTSCQT